MEQSQAAPIPPSERIVTLDVLRAFALLGILVMNMPFFFASGWSASPSSRAVAGHLRPRHLVGDGHLLLREVQLLVRLSLRCWIHHPIGTAARPVVASTDHLRATTDRALSPRGRTRPLAVDRRRAAHLRRSWHGADPATSCARPTRARHCHTRPADAHALFHLSAVHLFARRRAVGPRRWSRDWRT